MAFSVLMSVYIKEKPEYLSKALDSVIYQTLPPNEIVLIKDGPLTDELEKVIENKREIYPFFKIYQFRKNVQLGRALAKGVKLCKYDLVARMDSDDIAVKQRFEVQYNYMINHPEKSVCGGWIEEFSGDGTYRKIKKVPETMDKIYKYAKYRNPLNHMTVMFRKEAVLSVNNYRHFPFLEDYDLWIRMISANYKFVNIPQVLVKARMENGVYARRGGVQYCKNCLKLRKQQKKIGLLKTSEYIWSIVGTMVMTLQPDFIRKYICQKILRKKEKQYGKSTINCSSSL